MDLKEHHLWISIRKFSRWCWIQPDGYDCNIKGSDWSGYSYSGCGASNYYSKKIHGKGCENYFFFICGNNELNGVNYTFIPKTKTWSDAQDYCKNTHDFLAIFQSSDLSDVIHEQDFPVWIGLRREGGSWNWRTGSSGYANWTLGEPSENADCVSILSKTKRMATQSCDSRFPFVCTWENVFLVKENKSWEEALKHCQGLTFSNLHFDLLSIEPGQEHVYVWNKITEADTQEVWTGLRFLADEWLWMNEAEILYPDLPVCPIPGHHCGAFSKKDTGRMEARDCSERKNFLCYSYS
ncbi:uncharacterized protein LOC119617721 [Kryptolebias marmoratus]|uniref:uncharacterized protein LOC119617721 n=1 Tax=Kryptolebias marmoratus TaxID=37003 RepID=UPI0018ACF0CC|nr:uncharacterized protein LOC119617721 [Kryptolebias marmoratus]